MTYSLQKKSFVSNTLKFVHPSTDAVINILKRAKPDNVYPSVRRALQKSRTVALLVELENREERDLVYHIR